MLYPLSQRFGCSDRAYSSHRSHASHSGNGTFGNGKAHILRLVAGSGAMSTTLKSQTTCADKYTTARTRAISKVRSSRLAQRDIQNGPYIATKYRPHASPNNDTTAITAQTMSSLCMARRVSKRASGPRTTVLKHRPAPLLALPSWTSLHDGILYAHT